MTWYHRHSFTKDFCPRLDRAAVALSILTCAEIWYSELISGVFQEHVADDRNFTYAVDGQVSKMPSFLACRLAAFAIIMFWRIHAEADGKLVSSDPGHVQTRGLMSCCVLGLLMFVSYNAISAKRYGKDGNMWSDKLNPFSEEDYKNQRDMSFNFAALFILVYYCISTEFPFLFWRSVAFLATTCLILFFMRNTCDNLMHTNDIAFNGLSAISFFGTCVLNVFIADHNERMLRARFKEKLQMEDIQLRVGGMLNAVMPPMVVEALAHMGPSSDSFYTHIYHRATIVQADLCGFAKIASSKQPDEVVSLISEIFGKFDDLTVQHGIYKVETVGDAYIAGQAEPPLTQENSPLAVVLFGLEMVKATHKLSRKKRENVSCRVGVHTGFVVGGIVGMPMERYHLFGPMMSILEVLESTAPKGNVQVSSACRGAVDQELKACGRREDAWDRDQIAVFELREADELICPDGQAHDYGTVGGRTYIARSYAKSR